MMSLWYRNAEFAESRDVGLWPDEGKQVLNFIQHEFITAQAAEITERALAAEVIRCLGETHLKRADGYRVAATDSRGGCSSVEGLAFTVEQ
jgi:hypothetical protein